MKEQYTKDFLKKSEENYELFEYLHDKNIFIEWQAVAIFYSALCIAKAYLYSKGIGINTINSHKVIKNWLCTESVAKQKAVFIPYENLYRHSRNARYLTSKTINEDIISRMLKDYDIVKNALKIDIEKL